MTWRLALALLACLVVASCADSGNGSGSSDDGGKDRFGGFYTGGNLGGGVSR